MIPVGTLPGDSREITITSLDVTGLIDQLDDLLPSDHGAAVPAADLNMHALEAQTTAGGRPSGPLKCLAFMTVEPQPDQTCTRL